MTIQEAIEIIGTAQATRSVTLNHDFWHALRVAIQALNEKRDRETKRFKGL